MEKSREPHSVSLKGGELFQSAFPANANKKASLAVSPRRPRSIISTYPVSLRPTLSQKFPLPRQEKESLQIGDGEASELFSGANEEKFIISPLVRYGIILCVSFSLAHYARQLTLPQAFGSVYVGETFSCTLSANNDLDPEAEKMVMSIKIAAEMQTPSVKIPLDLLPSDAENSPALVHPGEPLKKTVRFEVREEGNHILAVTLSYSETTTSSDNARSSGRVRSFRKLYQFITQPCLSVRTKVSEILLSSSAAEKLKSSTPLRFALEAQLENMADGPITLEKVALTPKSPFTSKSINWDVFGLDQGHVESPILNPQKIWQVAFLLEKAHRHDGDHPDETTKDGRIVLGQLNIHWRTAMGEIGLLSTGWLMTRRR